MKHPAPSLIPAALVTLVFILLFGWALEKNDENRAKCEATGGEWHQYGVLGKGGHFECVRGDGYER